MTEPRDPLNDVNPRSGQALRALLFIVPMAVVLTAACAQGLSELVGPPPPPDPALGPWSRSSAVTVLWIMAPCAMFLWYAAGIIVVSTITGRSLPLLPWWGMGIIGVGFVAIAMVAILRGLSMGQARLVLDALRPLSFGVIAVLAAITLRHRRRKTQQRRGIH